MATALKIGDVSKRFNLPVSTLRYYDQQGFFPDMERTSGHRVFGERELRTIHVIECLKASGLSIEQISHFIAWCQEGDTSLERRLRLFEERKAALEQQLQELKRVQAMLEYKTWYYMTAVEQGSEEGVISLPDDELPVAIRQARALAYSV